MPSPPITLYMTTIASNPQLRKRQEYILRILQVKKIPYTAYDLASDPDAKRVWRRTAPADKQQLPGILVGQKFMGTASEFEDAVEHDELDIFLRLNEKWDPDLDDERPPPAAKVVGIPGAMTPQEMTPEHLRSRLYPTTTPAPSPLRGKSKPIPVNKRTDELNVGEELGEFGLEGVKVTKDELADLIAELGLDGDDAGDLAKGLSDFTAPTQPLKLGKSAVKKKTEESKISEEMKATNEEENRNDITTDKTSNEKDEIRKDEVPSNKEEQETETEVKAPKEEAQQETAKSEAVKDTEQVKEAEAKA